MSKHGTIQYDALLVELVKALPSDLLVELAQTASVELQRFLNTEGLVSVRGEQKRITKNCNSGHTLDYCLRGATSQKSTELMTLFFEKGAKDVLGALIKAAEAGSFELIEMLAEHATVEMFSMAAAHAALKGHLDLTKSLLESGKGNADDLNTVLFMAVEGGQISVIEWARNAGADVEKIPKGLIGRRIANVLKILGKRNSTAEENELYLFGAASFGDKLDLEYVMRTYGDFSPASRNLAFIGALQNNNAVGIQFLERLITIPRNEKNFYSDLCYSAALGNNLDYVNKYVKLAKKLFPALCVAVANDNLEMALLIKNSRRFTRTKNLALYAGYSGSSDMLARVDGWTELDPELICYGAMAGGNWETVEANLSLLETKPKEKILAILTQLFAEAITHSQLSMLQTLYSREKNIVLEDSVLTIENLRQVIENGKSGASKLTELKKSRIHPSVERMVNHILA